MTNEKQNIDMVMAIKLFFVNYFNFSGRASRAEFWWVYLALTIIGFVPLVGIFIQLVTFIGLISLTSRRLQDVGFSGWYQLIPYSILSLLIGLSLAEISSTPFAIFISVIVSITFIVFLAKPSIEEDNQWGNKPEHSTSNYSLGNNPKDW
jgi:uncharacterized membrane protein YhaH (DUF805 family)|tara:strand:- start:664 stop:1113 length:450 start_codon:yes stop_codon:yes gene_type:complete